ncbi:MAG: tRNA (N(6)-L-threonylcarbamoyladenosine(37)-C(2))-methylthiotransferase MtaB [Candidatus Omnitrophota bacterium]|jgi:threonylcarbamoyladenosine tRNA methylthiotransferase MtaB
MNSPANKDYKRFYIKTLGCKVNQYETQAMREILLKAGFRECLSPDIADIFIINTCTVTGEADKESRRLISFFHKVNPKAKIVVTGCYVERDAEDITFLPGVAHLIKNADKAKIASILDGGTEGSEISSGSILSVSDFKDHTKAFVKIQDGCENFCAYCKVPLVRGPIRSKPVMNVLEEVSNLVANGFKEIVLTGICLGSWGKDLSGPGSSGLVDVLKEFDRVRGDFRIRLSSIEPTYITDELIEFMSGSSMMCRHLHIPLQSGDDNILRKMNRPYTSQEYMTIVNKAKEKIKDVAITTDVLIGFPGESDLNFRNTIKVVKHTVPLKTHIFTYSRRKGTAAYSMEDLSPQNVLKKRYSELNTVALGSSYLYRSSFLNKELDVLVETKRDRTTGLLKGYSDNYIKMLFSGPDKLMRDVVPVKVDYINLMYTFGALG